ncbi:MAG: hypothetical protein H6618_10230 [Deltaproteobacteria bacterium]|nr:hypothetical protein [Deltaproteobacteria bacterium]
MKKNLSFVVREKSTQQSQTESLSSSFAGPGKKNRSPLLTQLRTLADALEKRVHEIIHS